MVRTLAIAAIALLLFAGAIRYALDRRPPPLGYSGLLFAEMTPAAAARTPLRGGGALIYAVTPASPGARARIVPGSVLAAIDGAAVTSAQQASDRIRRYRAGQSARLTVYDVTDGAAAPATVTLTFDRLPDPAKTGRYTVRPPRVLAREFFFPPPMAANAAWSRRIARGATIRPLELTGLGAGQCSGFAPDGWVVAGHAKDGSLFHVKANDAFAHALYQSVALDGRAAAQVLRQILADTFGAPATLTPPIPQPYGFSLVTFGNRKGGAGLVQYRVRGGRLQLWVAAVPGAEVAWSLPLAGAVAFSLNCAPGRTPRDPAMAATSLSLSCLRDNKCQDSDFAAAYMTTLKLGYVHDGTGRTWLVQPKRDLWANGADGPGFYRQTGGENEKLEAGRTN